MESYSFVVLAAVVGMGIVFAFLTLLSLVMVALRQVGGSSPEPGSPSVHPAPTPSGGVPTRAVPPWAVAAAVVYLDAERELEYGNASVWTGRRGR